MQSRRTSIADILESKKVNPEAFLQSLGFGGVDYSLLERLPTRFLRSQRDSILAEKFHSQHPEFKEHEEAEDMAVYAEVYGKLPHYFHNTRPSERCTSLHKIVASNSPFNRLNLSKRRLTAEALQSHEPINPVQKSLSMGAKRRTLRGRSVRSTLSVSTTMTLSSCDVTSSDDEELSPIVLQCRVPKFVFAKYSQDSILDNLAHESSDSSMRDSAPSIHIANDDVPSIRTGNDDTPPIITTNKKAPSILTANEKAPSIYTTTENALFVHTMNEIMTKENALSTQTPNADSQVFTPHFDANILFDEAESYSTERIKIQRQVRLDSGYDNLDQSEPAIVQKEDAVNHLDNTCEDENSLTKELHKQNQKGGVRFTIGQSSEGDYNSNTTLTSLTFYGSQQSTLVSSESDSDSDETYNQHSTLRYNQQEETKINQLETTIPTSLTNSHSVPVISSRVKKLQRFNNNIECAVCSRRRESKDESTQTHNALSEVVLHHKPTTTVSIPIKTRSKSSSSSIPIMSRSNLSTASIPIKARSKSASDAEKSYQCCALSLPDLIQDPWHQVHSHSNL